MRTLLLLIASLAAAQEFVSNPAAPRMPKSRYLLDNAGIVTLTKAGFDEQFIAELIQASRTRLDASVAALIALKKEGVSEELIRFVALRERTFDLPAPPPPPPAAPEPILYTRKSWWGYRWSTAPRNGFLPVTPAVPSLPGPSGAFPRPTTSSTTTTGAPTAPQAET